MRTSLLCYVIGALILNGVCCSSSPLKKDIVAQLVDLRSADKGSKTWNKYQTKEEVKSQDCLL